MAFDTPRIPAEDVTFSEPVGVKTSAGKTENSKQAVLNIYPRVVGNNQDYETKGPHVIFSKKDAPRAGRVDWMRIDFGKEVYIK